MKTYHVPEHLPPGDLRPYPENARTHSKKQLKRIATSIETFGSSNPVLFDRDAGILAGHGRVEAAALIGLGIGGRYRTNVWQYKGGNMMRKGRMDGLSLHTTVKPVQMIVNAIREFSGHDGFVLDLFGGSGSPLIAAEKAGRHA